MREEGRGEGEGDGDVEERLTLMTGLVWIGPCVPVPSFLINPLSPHFYPEASFPEYSCISPETTSLR